MKSLGLFFLIILTFSACQDGELPGDMDIDQEQFDTRCSISYVSGNFTGQVNSNFESSSDEPTGFVSYSTPTGIYVSGEQESIKLSIGINWYNGPGDYNISESNHIVVNVVDGAESTARYVSKTGTINVREFRSPQGKVCLKGVFSFEASVLESKLSESVSMINGEFEMTLP